MNLLETILQADGGGVVQNMAKSLGIGEPQTQGALKELLPSVARAISKNATSEDGVSRLLGALSSGNHQRYLNNPSMLSHEDCTREGNGILGHLFGSKDVSRGLATRAAAKTGVGADILKKMLPMVASVAMAALSQKATHSGLLGAQTQAPSTGLGGLSSFLDFDGDGSIADDLLGIAAKKFFG